MEFIDYVAILMLVVSAYIYISAAKFDTSISLDTFFYDSHNTKSKRYGASMAAASTSLATVVIFFITGVEQYGIFLFWCGLTYFVGQYGLLIIIKKSNIETKNLTTLADFWSEFSSCKQSSKVIAYLSATAFVFILFLELFIGSQILTFYLDEPSKLTSYLCFISLLLVVSIYIFKGGMHAVIKSDLWQYIMMLLSIVILFISSIIYTIETPSPLNFNFELLGAKDNIELTFFLIWVTIQNLTLPFTQLSSWQRLASTKSVDTAFLGLKEISIGFILLWFLPVVSMLIFKANSIYFSGIVEFFNFLRTSNILLVYLSYAIIFVGFSSALFSTADSALMAIALSLTDRSTFKNYIVNKSQGQYKSYFFGFIVILLIVETLLFILFSAQADSEFLSIVYVIFSQLSLIAPHIGYALYCKTKKINNITLESTQDLILSIGLLFSWILLFYFNFFGVDFGLNRNLSIIIGSLIGLFTSGFSLMITIFIKNFKQKEIKEF